MALPDHYEKARSLLAAAAHYAALTDGVDPTTPEYAAYRDSVTSSTAAAHAYATLALVDAVRALAVATTEPSGARGGEPSTEGAPA